MRVKASTLTLRVPQGDSPRCFFALIDANSKITENKTDDYPSHIIVNLK